VPLLEISFAIPNRPGALAGVARRLAENRINVAAISVESAGRKGTVRLIVSRPDRAVHLLREAGYEPTSAELLPVHLEERAGSLVEVLDCLAEARINVRSVTLLVQREGSRALVALGVSEPAKAVALLRKSGHYSTGAEGLVTNSDLVAAAPAIPSQSVGLLL
jgi:hypothetical protein